MAEAKQRHLSSVRRLAAIMFTDIVGYTKMMNKDEQDTLSILRRNRETHKKLILDFVNYTFIYFSPSSFHGIIMYKVFHFECI